QHAVEVKLVRLDRVRRSQSIVNGERIAVLQTARPSRQRRNDDRVSAIELKQPRLTVRTSDRERISVAELRARFRLDIAAERVIAIELKRIGLPHHVVFDNER